MAEIFQFPIQFRKQRLTERWRVETSKSSKDKVTLRISPEMRDQVVALARGLQRQKTGKDERITANTVMRVAIKLLLSKCKLEEDDVANTEEELLTIAEKKVRKRG